MGWPHPDYLLQVLTVDQLTEWAAFYSLEPWGFEVDERRFGMLGWAILKTVGWDGKPDDFTIVPKPAESGVTKLIRALGGEVRPRPKGS